VSHSSDRFEKSKHLLMAMLDQEESISYFLAEVYRPPMACDVDGMTSGVQFGTLCPRIPHTNIGGLATVTATTAATSTVELTSSTSLWPSTSLRRSSTQSRPQASLTGATSKPLARPTLMGSALSTAKSERFQTVTVCEATSRTLYHLFPPTATIVVATSGSAVASCPAAPRGADHASNNTIWSDQQGGYFLLQSGPRDEGQRGRFRMSLVLVGLVVGAVCVWIL
jgi:hypothetical protein